MDEDAFLLYSIPFSYPFLPPSLSVSKLLWLAINLIKEIHTG